MILELKVERKNNAVFFGGLCLHTWYKKGSINQIEVIRMLITRDDPSLNIIEIWQYFDNHLENTNTYFSYQSR